MALTASMVATTIFDPVALDDYYENFKKYGRLEQATVFLIPDRKTPPAAYERCNRLRKQGLHVVCPSIETQEAFLKKIGFDPHLVPYDSDNRRNVGFLMALESGAELFISIDDDNFPTGDEDFIGAHAVVCAPPHTEPVVTAEEKWYNICQLMELRPPVRTYPRGFPYYARHKDDNQTTSERRVNVSMNAGLWLKEPDVDAISWLVNPAHSVAVKDNPVVLDGATWTPVNTQNTAMHREVISCYYYLKMGYPIGGLILDRFGDIYSGYFSQACVKSMGGRVRVGNPATIHRRHAHHYMKDAANEWGGIMVLEDLLPWLTETEEIGGATYPEAYEALSVLLEDAVERFKGKLWNDPTRAYFHQMAYHMRRWSSVCRRLL